MAARAQLIARNGHGRRNGAEELPGNSDVERFVLGTILRRGEAFKSVAAILRPDHFALRKHQIIHHRICDIFGREGCVDRITVYSELESHGEIGQVDGLSYLVSLDDGLPSVTNLDSYVKILDRFAAQRRLLVVGEHLRNRVALGDDPQDILSSTHDLLATVAVDRPETIKSVSELPPLSNFGADDFTYIRRPELPYGLVVLLTGVPGDGKSTLLHAFARDAWARGIPSVFLDRENSIATVRERSARLGIRDSDGIRVWGGWLSEEAPLPDAPLIVDWVRASEPKPLVVIDSLAAFLRADENDVCAVRGFLDRCKRLADLGACVAVTHHCGKSESSQDFRGSSDIGAAIGVGLRLMATGGGRLSRLTLRFFKSRAGDWGNVSYSYDDGAFRRIDDEQQPVETVSERLLGLLRSHPGTTGRDFEQLAIKGKASSRSEAREFLEAGALNGSIRRETGAKNMKRHFVVENYVQK